MSELKRPKSELIDIAQEMLNVREEISTDRLSQLFSEITVVNYNILKRIWPELTECESLPTSKITLQDMQKSAEIPMHYISKIVERLSDAGLVSWERNESGTYIQLAEYGYNLFKKQQEILLRFFNQLINVMGLEKFHDTIMAVKEIETIINDVIID